MKQENTGRILRPLTILHSNDLHGDFLADEVDESLFGGISMLSGYVSKVRREAENVIYCIAGDMLQGSIIDSEFKGLSTIEIMNMLAPDIATIGNHEIDYGLAHLLFLERCAKFPIVNSNLYIKNPYTRLFKSHEVFEVDEMEILFIGITTEDIIRSIQNDILGSFVSLEDAAREVGIICNAYRDVDIDFTILLTHIGFEEDKKLAALLDPDWGVDLILGGHSHTILQQPEKVANILIAQAGVGTKQIGRFDIIVNTDTNNIHDFTWELIPIDSSHCPRDIEMEETIMEFKAKTDVKYDRVLCRLGRELTHPDRYQETELGNLIADILQEETGLDLFLVGSGSVRKELVSTLLKLSEFLEFFPYDDKLRQVKVTGAQLKRMLRFVFREEMFTCDHTEFYQLSAGIRVVFDRATREFVEFSLHGEPLDLDRLYAIGLQEFHFKNFEDFFGIPIDEVLANEKARVVGTSVHDILIEYLSCAQILNSGVTGRIEFKNRDCPCLNS
ncbi:MAG: bifunctional metallophosphatase/5'-nucleotidase [Propionibacteriaceae bacterium]|nr:bifunctional metallophosphatase/5'-nucleotidase [Propionibacteriaceae bacterium]